MASKPKYTQEICKLSQSSTRLKEQVAGRLLHYWKEDLKGGKSKICAVFLDGRTFQNVLTAEAWSDADQAHAEKHLKPLLGQVVALENGKISSKGKTTVFHGKQIKLSYDKETVVKKLDNNEKYGKALPLLTIADCSRLPSLCDGRQPFEVMQLQAITADEMMHEKLHKFQASEYQKFATGSAKMDITTTPSKDVHNVLSTPRQAKRLKIQNTNEIADPP